MILRNTIVKRGNRIIKRNPPGGDMKLPKKNHGGFLPYPADECIKSEFHRKVDGVVWIDLSICHTCELLVACHRRKAYMDHVNKFGVNAKPEGAHDD